MHELFKNYENEKSEKETILSIKKFIKAVCLEYNLVLSNRKRGPLYANHDLSLHLMQNSIFEICDNEELNLQLNILHEISHFLIASDDERKALNFGLGPDGSDLYDLDETHKEYNALNIFHEDKKARKIEELATVLHAALASKLGFNYPLLILDKFGYISSIFSEDPKDKASIKRNLKKLTTLEVIKKVA